MCVVGEWGGDTGSGAFTAALQAGWRLVAHVALPNWPDSAHELTVWERRGPASASQQPTGDLLAAAGAVKGLRSSPSVRISSRKRSRF